jgi:hypothetical protein
VRNWQEKSQKDTV